jgi:hypothetical protein
MRTGEKGLRSRVLLILRDVHFWLGNVERTRRSDSVLMFRMNLIVFGSTVDRSCPETLTQRGTGSEASPIEKSTIATVESEFDNTDYDGRKDRFLFIRPDRERRWHRSRSQVVVLGTLAVLCSSEVGSPLRFDVFVFERSEERILFRAYKRVSPLG